MYKDIEDYKDVAYGEIHKHYSLLFWKSCMFCMRDFKREQGYRFLLTGKGDWSYSCSRCSVSKSHCNDNVKYWKDTQRAKIKNIIPPPPPMRSYKND